MFAVNNVLGGSGLLTFAFGMSLYYVTLFRTFATPATRPERNVLTNSLRRFRDHRWQIAPHEQPNKRKERQRSHLNVRQ